MKVWGATAFALVMEIDDLQRGVITLMRHHASVKASGPAYAIQALECMAKELIGPTWRDLAARHAASNGFRYSPDYGWRYMGERDSE
jgi:hypothetical protein